LNSQLLASGFWKTAAEKSCERNFSSQPNQYR
jgi:hypothetical protein